MKRWIAGLLIFALMLGTLTACGDGGNEDRSFFYPLSSQPKSLDPQICADADTAIAVGSMYEGLVRIGDDGSIQPGVAQRMDVSGDGLVYTFFLRPDAKWHVIKNFDEIYGEGCEKYMEVPVTADDFVFTFQRLFNATTNAPNVDTLYAIKNAAAIMDGEVTLLELGVKALDPNTLQITLDRPCGDFLYLLTQPICMPCNRLFFSLTKGKYGLTLSTTMCNGPFYLSKWNLDTNLLLRRNPDYAGENEVIPGALYYYFNSDPQSYIKRINEGVYDAAPIKNQYLSELDNQLEKVTLHNTTCGLAFNCKDEILSNASFRMALCSAFSPETMDLPEGYAPAKGILPSGCYVDGTNYRDLVGAAEFPENSPDRAALFMQFALREMGTGSVSLAILCTEEYEPAMRKVIQHWQKVFGVSVAFSTKVVTPEELEQAQKDGKYQIAFMPVTAPSSSALLSLYALSNTDTSIFASEDPNYEVYLRLMLASPSAVSAASNCKSAESYLIRTGVFYPLFEETGTIAIYGGNSDISIPPCGETVNFTSAKKGS